MGDILAAVSRNDGDIWSEPVPIFDHRERHGAVQFAYANPVLYRAPGQEVIWCFAMRCPISKLRLASMFSSGGFAVQIRG